MRSAARYYWGASLELQTPLYFLPKDAGIKVAAFADAGSLWNYTGPTTFPATGEVISGNFCPTLVRASRIRRRVRSTMPCMFVVGRRRLNLGIAVRAAAVRLFIPALEGAVRPDPAVPFRRRDEILIPACGRGEWHWHDRALFLQSGTRAQRARDRRPHRRQAAARRRSRPPHHRDCSARSGRPQRSRVSRQAQNMRRSCPTSGAGACLTTKRYAGRAPAHVSVLCVAEPYRAFVEVTRDALSGRVAPVLLVRGERGRDRRLRPSERAPGKRRDRGSRRRHRPARRDRNRHGDQRRRRDRTQACASAATARSAPTPPSPIA